MHCPDLLHKDISIAVQQSGHERTISAYVSTFILQREQKVQATQEKQKAEYKSRKAKGVKTFNISVRMKVLKRNLRNETRQGGNMAQKWTGPYK